MSNSSTEAGGALCSAPRGTGMTASCTCVWPRTKNDVSPTCSVDLLAMVLVHLGISAEGVHGNMDQEHRAAALARFRNRKTSTLVRLPFHFNEEELVARILDVPAIDVPGKFSARSWLLLTLLMTLLVGCDGCGCARLRCAPT